MKKNSFKVNYVTTLPKEGNAPQVTINTNSNEKYKVILSECVSVKNIADLFINNGISEVAKYECNNNETVIPKVKQWFTNWIVLVCDENGIIVFKDVFNPQGRVVFIKMDAFALGDNIAWIPYVEEFRLKHKCNVICSTFYNKLFVEAYPNIMFVKPNTVIENVYAQYYIGASNDDNPYYSPIKTNKHPLQYVATNILGLDHIEMRPDLRSKYVNSLPRINDKYVTLSEYGSSENKHWKEENGWQSVVKFLNEKGYKVLVISKEKTQLTDVIDLSGDYSLDERAIDILHADFHLGISSGLSWLAWALGTHCVMISDVTPNWHEFQSDITRINSNDLSEVNYLVDTHTSLSYVLKKLGELVVS